MDNSILKMPPTQNFDFNQIIPLAGNHFHLINENSKHKKLIFVEELHHFNVENGSSQKELLNLTFSSISDVSMKCLEFCDRDSHQIVKALLLSVVDKIGQAKYYLLKMNEASTELKKVEHTDREALHTWATYENNFHNLSSREQEVLKQVAKGFTSDQIAEILFISPNTVKNHRKSIKRKLGFCCKQDYSKFLKWVLEYCYDGKE